MGFERAQMPNRYASTRQRFERWRQTRRGRSRIPVSLWASAVTMTRRHGICRTAKAFRLNYLSLKKRVEEKTDFSVLQTIRVRAAWTDLNLTQRRREDPVRSK